MRKFMCGVWHLFWGVAAVGFAAPVHAQSEARMVVGNAVACRAAPDTKSRVEHTFEAGDLLFAREERLHQGATWYLETSHARGGSPGCWTYGPLTVPYDRSNPESALLAAADRILAREDAVPFVEFVAIDNLLSTHTRRAHGSPAIETSPLLQLRRLQIVEAAVAAPGADRWTVARDPLKAAWMRFNSDVIRPFEPAGRWLLDPEAYWRLFGRHRAGAVGEEIAWAAAQATVGRDECYADCLLDLVQRTYARYWTAFPEGIHVAEALRRSADILTSPPGECRDIDTARARDLAAELRASLEPLPTAATSAFRSTLDSALGDCAP